MQKKNNNSNNMKL